MALFGNRKPKLPSYERVSLDALLQDPAWSGAIGEAGIDPAQCEVILRLVDCTVGHGGSPENASPAVLLGQGSTLAIAFPGEREIRVVKRETSRAQLQTQQSGWFQILFGPANSLDGFMFWGQADNLKLETPEGDKFGKAMSAFLKGQLKPQQVVGTPQSLVATGVSLEPPVPAFENPEDATRWKMVYAVHSSLLEMMDRYQLCFEKAENVEKAFGMANAEFVDGVRQHEISKQHFRNMAVEWERELEALLRELRATTLTAQAQWNDLLFLLPEAENDIMKVANWCIANSVDSEVMSSIAGNAIFIRTDFGVTRDSFWDQNNHIVAVMKAAGQ